MVLFGNVDIISQQLLKCPLANFLICLLLILSVPFTDPIEYQNYYERDPAADSNGSVGFVGGVMKRSELYSAALSLNE